MKMQIYSGVMKKMNKVALAVLFIIAAFAVVAGAVQLPMPIEAGTYYGQPELKGNTTDFLPGSISYAYTAPKFVDIDADGDYEVIAGYNIPSNDGRIGMWDKLSNGSMASSPTELYNPGDYNIKVSPVDFDRDGDYDIIYGRRDGYLRYLVNAGTPQSPSFVNKFLMMKYYVSTYSYPAPSLADIDNDGDYDMYLGGKTSTTSYQIDFFENIASEVSVDWDYASKEWVEDIGTYSSCNLVDLDSDDDFDMVCTNTGGDGYYFENEGNKTHQEWADSLDFVSAGQRTDLAFADMDNDTDYDFFMGKQDGYVMYYENVGTNKSYSFLNRSDIGIGSVGSYVTPALADIDNDGDYDLYLGDDTGDSVKYYTNGGNATNFSFSTLTSTPISSGVDNYPQPTFADFDNDGDYDLIVGMSNGTLTYYNNTGSVSSPSWTRIGNLLDIGANSAPGIADIDNDGDYDIAAGNSAGWCRIYYNDGNSTNVSISDQIYSWLYVESSQRPEPFFIDFDSDGDNDLIVSLYNGRILYYENTNTNSEPEFTFKYMIFDVGFYSDTSLTTYLGGYPTSSVDTSDFASPAIADIDNDGDYDMYIYNDNSVGDIMFFENMYSDRHSINWTYANSSFAQDIDGGDVSDMLRMAGVDLDGDNDTDIIAGQDDGILYFYNNTGNRTHPNFVTSPISLGIDVGSYSAPGLVDIDNDGDYDLASGNSVYTIMFWTNNGTNRSASWRRNSTIDVAQAQICTSCNYNHPIFKDIDNDGDMDLITANDFSANTKVVYTPNTGNAESAAWGTPVIWLTDSASHGSQMTSLIYEDFNNDSVMDLVLGSVGGAASYYVNEGTNSSPDFRVATGYKGASSSTNLWNSYSWTPDGFNNISVAGADMDDDGDTDIIVGTYDGTIHYLRNDGTYTGNTSAALYPIWIYSSVSVLPGTGEINDDVNHNYLKSKLVDIDEDGLYELVVNAQHTYAPQQRLYILENSGTAENPVWPSSVSYIADSYPQYYNSTYTPDLLNYGTPSIKDYDNDGDYDILIGYNYGQVKLVRNDGTNQNPEWNEVITEDLDYSIMDKLHGYYAKTDGYDMDDDGDMDYLLCTDRGDCVMMENRGYFSNYSKLAENQAWINHGFVLNFSAMGYTNAYPVPDFSDWDGDGDYDLAVGVNDNAAYGEVLLFENTGTRENANWTSRGTYVNITTASRYHPVPSFADFDGDNDMDLIIGTDDGNVIFNHSVATYTNNTVITLLTSASVGISGATVNISNSTSKFCNGTTDSKGHFSCDIASGTDDILVRVSGATNAATARVKVMSSNGLGNSFAELSTLSDNFRIYLKNLRAYVYTANNNTAVEIMRLEIKDRNKSMFTGTVNDSGYIDAYLPEKYLRYIGEQYTQNRITYDLEFVGNENYGSDLEFEDIYVPNLINLSSATDSNKLFKFPAAELMATDSQYKAYVIYPAVTAQKNYNLTDHIDGNFTFVGNATIYYRGSEVCQITPTGRNYTVTYLTPGCEALEDAVTATGDWFKVQYAISTPSLSYFQTKGWTSQQFTSSPAELKLLS